ncbi:MAG: hypothetical protein K2W95_19740 [Candidatus Obscuribacterales bacterium]|nr:hypothetical protein [Candidatus Obscuribacterales bacterium]
MYKKTLNLTALTLATLLSAEPTFAQMNTTTAASTLPPAAPLAFDSVNRIFREDYARAKREILEKSGAVIVCNNGALSLYQNGALKETIPFIKPAYTGLKELAHIPLASYVVLINQVDEHSPQKACALNTETIARLSGLQQAVQAASKKMSDSGVPQQSMERQQQIINRTDAFLGAALTRKQMSYEQLNAFTRGITALEMRNADGAADSQISSMAQIVAKWKDAMPAAEWNKIRAVVVSGHMPRAQNSSGQFFANLLHEKREGGRLIIIETAPDDAAALDSFATHVLDGKIAVDFFGDPWRMHRDLLSDSITKSLKKGIQKQQ